MFRTRLLIALFVLSFIALTDTSLEAKSAFRMQLNVGSPAYVAYPAPAPVIVSPAPIYVQPAPVMVRQAQTVFAPQAQTVVQPQAAIVPTAPAVAYAHYYAQPTYVVPAQPVVVKPARPQGFFGFNWGFSFR